jgi:tetratricopeptide (TPR) repeat protein
LSAPSLDERIGSHLDTLEAAPGDGEAFRALEEAYRAAGRFEDLVALYERRARLVPEPGAPLLARAAEIARGELGNLARAEELYRAVLRADPAHRAALSALAEIAAERRDWPAHAAMLERAARAAADPREAARIAVRLGRVLEERLGRRDRAGLQYARALRLDPSLAQARARALACFLALRRFGHAKRILDAARDAGADRSALAADYARLGAALADEPLEHGLALDALVEALALDRSAPGAAQARERLKALPRTWREEAKALEARASRAADRREAAALQLVLAQLHAAYDPEGAARVVERVERAWALAPGSAVALDLLERTFGERSDWRGLADALGRLAGATRDRAALVQLHLRRAQVDLIRFGDAQAAVASLERALELDPAGESAAQQAFEHHMDAGRHREALAVVERHLAAAPEKPAHATLRLRAAEIALGKLDDRSRGRRHLEAALRADPGNAGAAAALAPLLSEAGEWQRLVEVLESTLPGAGPHPAEQIRVLERIAEVELDRLDRPLDALQTLSRALALDPRRALTRRAMEGAAARAGAFAELARAYRSAAEAVGDDLKSRKTLLRRVAEIHDRDLEQPEEAIVAYRALAAIDPDDRGGAAALQACLERAGRREEAARELRARVEGAAGTERREAATRLARLHREAAEPEKAAAVWRELLAADRDDAEALRGLEAALGQVPGAAAAEERLQVLGRLALRTAGHAERAAVELERAEILAEPLGRHGEAAGAALSVVQGGGLAPPLRARAVSLLERMLARGVDPLRIAQALAPIHAAAGEVEKQVTMLELLARSLPGGADPREQARHLLDAAAVRAEKLGDPRGALSDAAAALRACPDHAEARRLCERLASQVGAFGELFALLVEAALALEGRPEEELAMRQRAATVAEEDLGSPEDAAAQLQRCLALRPGDPDLLASLTRVALAGERWEEAAALLAERARPAGRVERAALLGQRAEILLERVGDPGGAAAAYREALAIAAEDHRPRLLGGLADALARAGDDAGRTAALQDLEANAADPTQAARAAVEGARVRIGRGDALGAVERLRAALAANPDDPAALDELERRLSDPDPEVVVAAARVLAPAHARRGDPRRRLQALEAEARATSDPAVRAAAMRQAARVYENDLRKGTLAFAALADAARAVPGDSAVRAELRRLADENHDAEACTRVYDELADRAGPEARVAVLRELAQWTEGHLGRERAVDAWSRVSATAPGDLEALGALRRLHRAAEAWDRLVEIDLALAGRAGSPAAREEALREAASVAETRLVDPARAADAWRQVLEVAPGDPHASAALERLADRLGRPEELARLLEERIARSPDREAILRLADLRGRLGDPAGAVELHARLLEGSPGHLPSLEALARIAAEPGEAGREALRVLDGALAPAGDHGRRIAAREGRLGAVEDPEERARLLDEIRAIHEEDLGEPAMAFAAAGRAFEEGGAARAAAEEAVVRLAAATGGHEELAALYERCASSAEPAEAVDLLRAAARLRDGEARDAAGATAAWRGVLEAVPDDAEALDALERLYAAARSAQELLEVARRRAALASGPDRAGHLLRVAELCEAAGDAGAAVDALREARAADPGRVEPLEALERIFTREKRVDELAETLGDLAADLGGRDPARRVEVLLRRAACLEGHPDARRPLEAFADVLAESPREPGAVLGLERMLARPDARGGAARLLEDVHRMAGDARRLASVLEIRLEEADEAERPPLLAEVAALRERAGDKGQAFQAKLRQFRETVRGGRDAPGLRAELERLGTETGRFEDLRAALEEALAAGLPPRAALEVKRRLAGLCAERLRRLDDAARWYEEVAAEAPGPEVLGALARLHRRRGAHRDLARALTRLAEVSVAPAAKKELLLEVAKVMEEHLSDREGAIEAYRKILAVDPEDPNALRLLGKLLGSAERWEDLAEVLAREVEIADARQGFGAEAAELRFRLGRIRHQRLSDAEGALACYREVLERAPRHPGALAALEDLARTSGLVAVEAAGLLEPIYSAEGEHAKVIETLEARAANEADPAGRAALLRRVAEVYAGPLRNPEMAFLAAGRALSADPDSAESLAQAVRHASEAGTTDELQGLLLENADRAADPATRAELHRWIARTSAEPLAAAEAWQRVLDLVPDDREALSGLVTAHRAGTDAGALAQALRRALATEEDPAARVGLLAELGQVQEERLGDAAGALQTLKRLVETDGANREALARLDRVCLRTERWVELGDVLAREASAAEAAGDAAAATAFRYRLGELKETRLLDREGALSLYEEVLTASPEHAETVARLEAMLQKDPALSRAALLLEGAYAGGGAWGKKAAVLELRANERPDPTERRALWLELAQIRENHLRDPELAFLAVCKAFRDDPADLAVRAEMERLAEASEHHEELAAIYEDELERLPPAGTAALCLRLGQLYEEKLGGPSEAAGFFRRALALDPGTAPATLPALERLYARLEKWGDLADVLGARAQASSGAERVAVLHRLGQLCVERLGAPDRAAEAWEEAVAADPRAVPSLRALEALYEEAGRKEDLLRVLAGQRAAAADPASRERVLPKLAALAAELGRADEAVGLWKEVLAQKPRHEPALAALEELYERLERWPELAQHLRVRLSSTVDRREVTRLNDKLGWLMGAKLGDAAQAIQSYKAVLDADPKNRRALEALRDIHAAQGDLEGLAGAYRRLVPLQEDAAGVKRTRLELGEVLLRAGNKPEAIEQAKRAFDIEPHEVEDLVRIEEILGGAGAAADGVRVAEARASLLAARGGPAEAVPAWLSVAELWKANKRPEAAAAALEKVLELDPASRDAYEGLRTLHAAAGNWRAWARTCDAFVAHLPDPAEKLAVRKEVAEVQEKKLGQKDMAFLAWCRALAEAPGDPGSLAEAERLAVETEAVDELAAVLEQVSEEESGPDRARLLLRLGRLRDERLDDAAGAEAAYRKALEADPGSPEALDALTSLFRGRGRVRELVITLEQKLEAAASLEDKKATLLEVARIYDRDLGDVEEAVTALRRVLELDGGDQPALEALSALYRREKRWHELVSVLARARDLAASEEARVAFQVDVAAVHENELDDVEAAVEAWRSVLALDDRNAEGLAGLERLYTRLDRFAELNRIYERQVSLAEDPREKIRILARSAGIFEEKMHDPARAIERNEAILSLDGGNLPAVKALERLYREQGQWERLISLLQHHLTLVKDREETVALEVAIGDVWWRELSRVDRAEAIFNHALKLDPDSREAVSALARLYERSGNWNLALDMMRREARIAGASKEAVDVHVRMGAIHEEMLLDVASAREAYGRALQLDPGCLPAIRALKGIAERERDRDLYLEMTVAEARYAEEPEEKARLFTEAGRILQDERDDRDGAARHYEEALKRVPGWLAAGRPLADIHVAATRWADAERVLDAVVATLETAGDPKELCRHAYRLGYVAEKQGKREKALAEYRRAYELDSTYLPALEGLGNLLVAGEQWEEALRIFTAILIHHRDGLTDLEVVETHWQIGEVASKLGQVERAVNAFKKALEIDANHEPSRRSLVRLLEGMGDWEGAVEQRQRLAPLLEGTAGFEMYMAIGEACRDRLKDAYQAIDAFLAASRIDPTDVKVTEALLGLYRETRQGQKAADALTQILARPEVKADASRAAALHLALGEVLRDEVKDDAGAVKEMERALDRNPRLVQAFAALEEILTRGKRWSELEQAYVRMIQRLPKTQEVAQARLGLWRTLGELYRNVLKNEDGARQAFQVVARADPEDAVAQELYADLAARKPGEEGEAIAAYRNLVRAGTKAQKATSALIGLHAARKEYDLAYSAAQVLAHVLGGASQEEVQVVSRLRKMAREQASGRLDDGAWALLLHERVKGPLADVMTLLALQARPMFVQAPKALGLNPKKDELDVEGSMLFFANMFKYATRTLGLPALRLFRREEVASRLQLVATDPPGLVAAEEMFAERPKKELWFGIGKAACFERPELFMARLMPHDQLDLVFQAACSLGTSRFVVTADLHTVEKLKIQLEKVLPENVRKNTLKLLARQYCDVQHPGDVRAYLDGAEHTSNRVGTLLAGDLEVVRKAVVSEKAQVSKLREEAKLKDLAAFCTSQEYATLRQRLGLAVAVPG